MTLSKYCRMAGVHLIDLSKTSGRTIPDLNTMYESNIIEFSNFIDMFSDGLLPISDIMRKYNISQLKVKSWLVLGIRSNKIDNVRYVDYREVEDRL